MALVQPSVEERLARIERQLEGLDERLVALFGPATGQFGTSTRPETRNFSKLLLDLELGMNLLQVARLRTTVDVDSTTPGVSSGAIQAGTSVAQLLAMRVIQEQS